MEINKVIIPATDLAANFLPYTKTIAKEMLPLLQKPVIHYIAQEALNSALTNLLIITGKNRHAIADYFDSTTMLEQYLNLQNKEPLISSVEKISRLAQFTYIHQNEALSIGHALWSARHAINKEYFAIAMPDEIITGKQSTLAQLIRIARQEKASIIAVQEVPTECTQMHSMVAIKKQITPNLFQLSHIVDKPMPKDSPSSLAVVGRYILSHKFFNSLEQISTYSDGELCVSDAICHMMQHNERIYAYKIQGTRYDISNPLGWTKAVIAFALQDPELSPNIKKFIAQLNQNDTFLFNPSKVVEHGL